MIPAHDHIRTGPLAEGEVDALVFHHNVDVLSSLYHCLIPIPFALTRQSMKIPFVSNITIDSSFVQFGLLAVELTFDLSIRPWSLRRSPGNRGSTTDTCI
ncbi:hypothetical protein FPOAC2_10462 [Fusarium poae]|jgi:hypothetical protein